MTASPNEALAALQRAYDVVKKPTADRPPREIALGDLIIEDLDLDSLDVVDVVFLLEETFAPDAIDAAIERAPELRTVGDLVDALLGS